VPFYAFPSEVRRLLYTTNAIEALNAKLRRAVRTRGHFPTDEAALKLLFLVLNRSEKEWTMPVREWCLAKAQFAILFGERSGKTHEGLSSYAWSRFGGGTAPETSLVPAKDESSEPIVDLSWAWIGFMREPCV
jgi:hypothetical protein